jgi:hypothetical protein
LRPADQVALGGGHAEVAQRRQLRLGLHALRDDRRAEVAREADRCRNNGALGAVAVDAADQLGSDLHDVRSQPVQVTQAREAGTGVVHRHAHAGPSQVGQRLGERVVGRDAQVLGQLEHDAVRRQSLERPLTRGRADDLRRHVDGEVARRRQLVESPRGHPHRQHLQLRTETDLGGLGEPPVRRSHRLGAEPGQRLGAEQVAVLQTDDGLVVHGQAVPLQDGADPGRAFLRLLHSLVPMGTLPLHCQLQGLHALPEPGIARPRLEQIAHTQHRLRGVERLAQQVVGTGRQRPFPGPGGQVRREHDHRQEVVRRYQRAQPVQHLEAVHDRHVQIEQDQIRSELLHQADRLARVGGAEGDGPVGGQHALEQQNIGGGVVHDEHLHVRHRHASPLSRSVAPADHGNDASGAGGQEVVRRRSSGGLPPRSRLISTCPACVHVELRVVPTDGLMRARTPRAACTSTSGLMTRTLRWLVWLLMARSVLTSARAMRLGSCWQIPKATSSAFLGSGVNRCPSAACR